MFDDPTIELIQAAPALDGLDAASLPRTLTQAYAEIVAVRMRVRELANKQSDTRELLTDIKRQLVVLQRLAFTQEAIASVEPQGLRRRAAAFVAGTAHYVALQAMRLIEEDADGRQNSLSVQGISAEVSATLLFLAAGASADAAELSKEIPSDEAPHNVEARLLLDVKRLANGRLDEMLSDRQMPSPLFELESLQRVETADFGAKVLYLTLVKCMHCIAADILGRDGYEGPLSALARVEALCTEEILRFPDGRTVHSTYAGPRHLASLLRIVAKELPADSLVKLPTPPNLNDAAWKLGLASIAKSRPYLWANHRDAVKQGYLTPGVSSAVSFPTGAGKSTLSELKIHATLCRGLDVVFLAPTLALVDQTARALVRTFPDARLARERANDNPFDFVDDTRLQPITVMTPERCLSMVGFSPELFREVGLVVFDECHLLHGDHGRRSVDSMLCILNLAKLASNADFLLMSAMMSNALEISAWLADLTSRPCLSLSMAWKPTRQVRGSVVYSNAEIEGLRQSLATAHRQRKTLGPPASLKREIKALPQGLLALNFRWISARREDYTLLKLSEQSMPLAVNAHWGLTANANDVAAGLAALASSNRRTKSLVFAQTIVSACSAQRTAGALLRDGKPISLTIEEQHLYSLSLAEMGQPSALYIDVKDGGVTMPSLCHHGLLLPTERQLHESMFKRPDGVLVLVATSTLAQGMNLPSNVVIIAGDSKYDESKNRLSTMHAHELLNAAGRAGRAGESAYGLVLVVPSKIVTVDDTSKEPSSNWNDLQSIFAQSDQCLAIEDPFEEVLDLIQTWGRLPDGHADYLLRRLPIGSGPDDVDDPAKDLLRKSLSGYRARTRGTEAIFEGAIGVVLKAREELLELDFGADWADKMAATFGAPPWALRRLKHRLEATPPLGRGLNDWFEWTANWVRESPSLLSELTRPDSLNGFMGTEFEALDGHQQRGEAALPVVLPALSEWIRGTTLFGMQRFREPLRIDLKQCDQARKFVVRLLPELAHIFSLPELVRRTLEMEVLTSVHLERLGHCVRGGFDTVEKLAMARLKAKVLSRVGVHKKWDAIAWWIPDATPNETWQEVYERVKQGISNYETP